MDGITDILIGKFGFDIRAGIFTILNFFIIFLILKKSLFGKIEKSMTERQSIIDQGINNYQKAQEELDNAKAKSDEVINNAKKEANLIIEKSHLEAEKLGENLRKQTESDVKGMLTNAEGRINKMENDMKVEFNKYAVDLISAVTEKFLSKKVNSEDEKVLVNDLIRNFSEKKTNG